MRCGMGKINAKKVDLDGYTFDSQTEAEYYLFLKSQDDIKHIEVHPKYLLLHPFHIPCNRCRGEGKAPSPSTGKPIQCKRCKGSGKKERQGTEYTADFQVYYKDGYTEVIDVKGFINDRFPLYKKLFEHEYNVELVVVQKKKGEWVRK